jgi:hypothetical protein
MSSTVSRAVRSESRSDRPATSTQSSTDRRPAQLPRIVAGRPSKAADGRAFRGASQARRPELDRPEGRPNGDRLPDPILFQEWFRSVGPRTYAAQVRRAGNGNHYLVLTEGKRNENEDEARKTRLYVYSEDFTAMFKLFDAARKYIIENPMPADAIRRREQYWLKKNQKADKGPQVVNSPSTRR